MRRRASVVIRVVAVINNAVSGLDLNLGITDKGDYVVVMRDVVECVLVSSKSSRARRPCAQQESL
jgi:hypothetical protein